MQQHTYLTKLHGRTFILSSQMPQPLVIQSLITPISALIGINAYQISYHLRLLISSPMAYILPSIFLGIPSRAMALGSRAACDIFRSDALGKNRCQPTVLSDEELHVVMVPDLSFEPILCTAFISMVTIPPFILQNGKHHWSKHLFTMYTLHFHHQLIRLSFWD